MASTVDPNPTSNAPPYAGDLSPEESWALLSRESGAVLVDCRSQAEWSFVGLPDLARIGKTTQRIAWQTFPGMIANPEFAAQVAAACPDRGASLVFLCRSGVRSRNAAIAMTAQGYRRCYNLAGGFEGPHDEARHRGGVAGWKAAGLPWVQE